ncbi:MAG: aminotransferase class V-fold PLP-dependent enzyme [Clostridiales bacterium]|jgi:arginine/lysine/ornithine decarboxylase|nr:aminotransferase class V-fold PLP-dependent enzyme [Clostridiales bacterium]
MKLKTPISDCIKHYVKKKPVRFHTPGHQGVKNRGFFKGAEYDITELFFSDNLLFSDGVIRESEEQASELYGTFGTLYFTNGATSAIFAAVAAAVEGKKALKKSILIAKNAHRSVYNAADVCGLKKVFFDLADDGDGYFVPAKSSDIERALQNNEDVCAVVITSPDYFGRCAETSKIFEVTRKYGVTLIADAAHGAHFSFCGLLPDSAARNADYAIESCHKTMPVLTGGAVLHCANHELKVKAEQKRAVFHSSSPNYSILASLEYAIVNFAERGESLYGKMHKSIAAFQEIVESAGYKSQNSVFNMDNDDGFKYDFSRIVISGEGYSGEEIRRLLEKRNIFAEMSYGNRAVFISTPYNADAVYRLAEALRDIKAAKKNMELRSAFNEKDDGGKDEATAACLSDAPIEGAEYIKLEECEGRIAAVEIGVYPPGTPIAVNGDTITRRAADILIKNRKSLYGLKEGKICVYER